MTTRKFNVVALGARDSYEVAVALIEANALGYLITDFYAPPFLQKKVPTRWRAELPSSKTISFIPSGLILRVLAKRRKNRLISFLVDDLFGFVAGFLTWMTTDRAVVYSYYLRGFLSFYAIVRRKPSSLICFQVHPTSWYCKEVLSRDYQKLPSAIAANMLRDPEEVVGSDHASEYRALLSHCDLIFCASSVTARSISASAGAEHAKILRIVPYGGKTIRGFHKFEQPKSKIKLLSVCQLTHRKGMHWAFEAMASLPQETQDLFDWTVVAYKRDPEIIKFAPTNVRFRDYVEREELTQLYLNADLFVLPSLLEGFGLVYLESLSMGTPVLYTEETGAVDICEDQVHGFQVQAGNPSQIASVFIRIAKDPIPLSDMRANCLRLADSVNWSTFRKKIMADLQATGLT